MYITYSGKDSQRHFMADLMDVIHFAVLLIIGRDCRPLTGRTQTSTDLHEEEARHDVLAGLLQTSLLRKAPHHPPLC